jgi:hypothetical protein
VTRADWFRSNDDRIGDLIASNTDCFPFVGLGVLLRSTVKFKKPDFLKPSTRFQS